MTTADLAEPSSTTDSPASNQPATRHKHRLAGCSPTPLAHYLKALAVLRLVCEQADPTARGFWRRDDFVLDTALDRQELVAFFLDDYRPTPLITPWNAGSGLWTKYEEEDFKKFEISSDEIRNLYRSQVDRFCSISAVIDSTREAIRRSAFQMPEKSKKRNTKEYERQKTKLISACRSLWPEVALCWLDAAIVLTGDGPKFPPVLGTGGNDGRLDFALNFLQRLPKLFDFDTGQPTHGADAWLRVALFGQADSHLEVKASIGQFFPSSAGGTNQDSSFDAKSLSNPWDFVLMLEGAVVFAAASVKQLGASGSAQLSAPFCVRHVGVGHGSADNSEEADARPEMWLPLWQRAVSAAELQTLMAEGRANVGRAGRRGVRDAVDFARAAASLGIDRGISAFVRYGFQVRNGRAYFATPLGRIQVRRRPETDVINEIDAWLDRFTGKARSDKAPGAVKSASQRLREAIFSFCQTGSNSRLTAVLTALGGCERVLARRISWAADNFVRPLAGLSQQWLRQAYDGSAEFRLAASLASVFGNYSTDARPDYVPFRSHLEPIDAGPNGYVTWDKEAANDVTWHDGEPIDALNAVMRRRLIIAGQAGLDTWSDRGRWTDLADIAAFTAGRIDLRRLAELLWGLMLVDWREVDYPVFEKPALDRPGLDKGAPSPTDSASADNSSAHRRHPGALYALLKLCFAGGSLTAGGGESVDIPLAPVIHRHAADGQGGRASRQAARRLRASGVCPAMRHIRVQNAAARRTAAALLFPISTVDLHYLKRLVVDTSDN